MPLYVEGALPSDTIRAIRAANVHLSYGEEWAAALPQVVFVLDWERALTEERLSAIEAAVNSGVVLAGKWLVDEIAKLGRDDHVAAVDMKAIIARRQRVFAAVRITTTNFVKQDMKLIALWATSAGMSIDRNLTKDATVLIISQAGSPKHYTAGQTNLPLRECFTHGELARYEDYSVPPLFGLIISISQLEADERNALKILIERNGGIYAPEFSFNCTQLIAYEPTGEKFEFACRYNIAVVRPDWVPAMIAGNGSRTDSEEYSVDKPQLSTLPQPQPQQLQSRVPLANLNFGRSYGAVAATPAVRRSASTTEFASVPDCVTFDASNDTYLSGCVVTLVGFSDDRVQGRLAKIIRVGGGTRLDQVRPFSTHVVVASSSADQTPWYHCRVVNLAWLVACYHARSCVPITVDHVPKARMDAGATKPPMQGQLQVRSSSFYDNRTRTPLEETECLSVAAGTTARIDPAVSPANFSQFNRALDANSQGAGRGDSRSLPHLLFSGRNFGLEHPSLDNCDREEARNDILAHGGLIIETGDASAACMHFCIARYLIATTSQPPLLFSDIAQLWTQPSSEKPIIVTLEWIRSCTNAGRLLSPCDNIAFLPIPKNPKIKAFHERSITVALSQFVGDERDLIGSIVRKFGGRCRQNFVKQNTVLICCYPDAGSNQKQIMAVKWRIPIVHFSWLYDSVISGLPLPTRLYEQMLAATPTPSATVAITPSARPATTPVPTVRHRARTPKLVPERPLTDTSDIESVFTKDLHCAVNRRVPTKAAMTPRSKGIRRQAVPMLMSPLVIDAPVADTAVPAHHEPARASSIGAAASSISQGDVESMIALAANTSLSGSMVSDGGRHLSASRSRPRSSALGNRFDLARQDGELLTPTAVHLQQQQSAQMEIDDDEMGSFDVDCDPVHMARLSTTYASLGGANKRMADHSLTNPSSAKQMRIVPVPIVDKGLIATASRSRPLPKPAPVAQCRFVLSRFSSTESVELERKIVKLGGSVIRAPDEPLENCTHVVTATLQRVEKIMHGLLIGKWIVRPSMIFESEAKGEFVSPATHDWSIEMPEMDEDERSMAKAIQHWRKTTNGPFDDFVVVLCLNDVTKQSVYERLLVAGGAASVTFGSKDGAGGQGWPTDRPVSYACFDQSAVALYSSTVDRAKHDGVPCLLVEFIITSIVSPESAKDISTFMIMDNNPPALVTPRSATPPPQPKNSNAIRRSTRKR